MNGVLRVFAHLARLHVLLLVSVTLCCAGCTMSPERAKAKLEKKQVPFTVEAMRAAIGRADVETVKLFLAAGMSPNVLPPAAQDGPIPEDNLRIAIRSGNKEIVTVLLQSGADVNCRNHLGETPLFSSLVRDDPEITKVLIDRGANISAESNYGQTATVVAVRIGRIGAVKLFLAKGVGINTEDTKGRSLLFHAAGSHNAEMTKFILDMGGEVNKADQGGATPLLQAAMTGQLPHVKHLLAKGADVHARDEEGRSPLMVASASNSLDIMQALLESGAPADMDALIKASERGHVDAVRMLLSKNGDALIPFAAEALTRAAANGNASVVALLVENGVAVDSRDANNETAIASAARRGHDGTVKVLQEKGADTSNLPVKSTFQPEMMNPEVKRPMKYVFKGRD